MKNRIVWFVLLTVIAMIIVVTWNLNTNDIKKVTPVINEKISKTGVCPPFYLLTENGDTINPITGQNIDKPYSPKQTCGVCHDYDKITQGFHFQQGKDENPDTTLTNRSQWVSHPGNYGGNWCSPAPLYSYLSDKENSNEKLIDMTSYTFVNKCGVCHPGGGSLEYDRNGLRYDKVMNDSVLNYKDGEKNNLDGDYYQAKWSKSGVIEADCYICHLPEYDNKKRVNQIQNENYKYAALVGSGFGEVDGFVKDNQEVKVRYNNEKFNADGTVSPNIVSEPRNSACLNCHAKPGYKKRGANFAARTDVHINAGLKCVDCHPAGSMATDNRINGHEEHQIAKGNDPGGVVRNDLDNTMRTCTDCHNNGYLGAPLAKHEWLPGLHLDKIACQTCHVPERYVKSAHYVASDVFNPGTKIPTKGKYLWTFYGPDMKYWNHYGDLEMMGYNDKPTFNFKPELVKYNGQIFPANRVHTSWPGIMIKGKKGLMQPKMGDVYKMWASHKKDKTKYADLAKITDDNADEVIEINRPEEINALIQSISQMLKDIDYPMDDKQVVWVMDNRIYTSGSEYTEIPMKEWEASPYGNVHTYNHDIMPAQGALGSKSCTECHSLNSDVFYTQVLQYPVGNNGNPVHQSQYKVLGMNPFNVWLSAIREQFVKTAEYPAVIFLLVTLMLSAISNFNRKKAYYKITKSNLALIYLGLIGSFLLVYLKPDLHSYILPDRMWFDKNHFFISLVPLLAALFIIADLSKTRLKSITYKLLLTAVIFTLFMGVLILIKFDAIYPIVQIAYSVYDIGVLIIALILLFHIINIQINNLTEYKSIS